MSHSLFEYRYQLFVRIVVRWLFHNDKRVAFQVPHIFGKTFVQWLRFVAKFGFHKIPKLVDCTIAIDKRPKKIAKFVQMYIRHLRLVKE